MFNIGWAELLVLTIAGLFILGPERLPAAAAGSARLIRQIREYAHSARTQLETEMGPEFDEIRKPLQDLGELRSVNPKRAMAKHLFADLDTHDPAHPASFPKRPTTIDTTAPRRDVDPTATSFHIDPDGT